MAVAASDEGAHLAQSLALLPLRGIPMTALTQGLGIAERILLFLRRNRLTDQVADDVRDCLGNLVFETVIPRNVRLSEAPSHGLPALVYDHACVGSRAYIALARELIGRFPPERKAA